MNSSTQSSFGMMTWVTPAGRIWTRGLGGAHGFAGPAGFGAAATPTVKGDFYGSGGFAYSVDTWTGTPTFKIVQAPKGHTLGKVVYSGSDAWRAILVEYQAAVSAGQIKAYGSIPQKYTGTVSGGGTTVPRNATTGASDVRVSPTGKPDGLSVFTTVTDALTPLATGLAQAFSGGAMGLGGNDPAQIAATIARKERELALTPTTNTPKRARLQAEIQQLRQAQSLYAGSVETSMSDLGIGGGQVAAPAAGASWLPVVGALAGGAAVLGGVYWLAQGRRK